MAFLIWLTVLITILWSLGYHRASLMATTMITTVVMLIGSMTGTIWAFSWLLFLLIAIVLNVKGIRQQYLSLPALKIFRKIMPQMSPAEKAAIDSGSSWWETDLVCGTPDWQTLHKFPQPRLNSQEQAFLDGPVKTLCQMTHSDSDSDSDSDENNRQDNDLSPEVWQYLKEQRFFAIIIQSQYGGLAFSAYARSCILQRLASKSMILATIVGSPNALGLGELLQRYGTGAQKDHYLPRLTKGLELPGFTLTHSQTGLDAAAITDCAVVCKDRFNGKEVLGMRLDWSKRHIPLAPVATVLAVVVNLFDPQRLLNGEKDLGLTCVLIPTETPGVKMGHHHFPLNATSGYGPTRGEAVFVPLNYIIGGQEMAGQGSRMIGETISTGQAITLASVASGYIKTLAITSGAYTRVRRRFKLPIGKMEGDEAVLARISGYAYMADAASTLLAGAIDLGEKPAVISAIVSYHLSRKMRQAHIDAIDLHDGGDIGHATDTVAKAHLNALLSITAQGTNILACNATIYAQGVINSHPFVLEELVAARLENETGALERFDRAVFGHSGFVISNALRTLWLSLSNARLTKAPFADQSKYYYRQMDRFSAALAFVLDVALVILNDDLKRKEQIPVRLGDVLSMLYLTSASLKRFNDEGRQDGSLALMQWAAEDCLYQAQQTLSELLDNFPNRLVGRLMKTMVFPLGLTLKKPSDMLAHKIARLMQTPNDTRDLLSQGMYLTPEPGNPIGLQEQALKDLLAAEPAYDKVCRINGEKLPFSRLNEVAEKGLILNAITGHEAQLLHCAQTSRLKIIGVRARLL